MGWKSIGIDKSDVCIRAAWAAQMWPQSRRGERPNYIKADALEWIRDCKDEFDACLCTSVFMHVCAKHGKEAAWELLDRASRLCPVMFFDCGFGAYSKDLPFTPQDMCEQIIGHTAYVASRKLGVGVRENRGFFVFKR
jgi:hypothetical protein